MKVKKNNENNGVLLTLGEGAAWELIWGPQNVFILPVSRKDEDGKCPKL